MGLLCKHHQPNRKQPHKRNLDRRQAVHVQGDAHQAGEQHRIARTMKRGKGTASRQTDLKVFIANDGLDGGNPVALAPTAFLRACGVECVSVCVCVCLCVSVCVSVCVCVCACVLQCRCGEDQQRALCAHAVASHAHKYTRAKRKASEEMM